MTRLQAACFESAPPQEDEADAIVRIAFAPILNQHVRDGKIVSWNWMEHLVGGKYRRLLVLDGPDHKGLG